MTNKDIQRILLEKEVAHLYHANSMATACTFLENGGLLSRGAVEDFGLYQTPQETDATDKLLDVYYDIFFDSVDIHERIGKINHYGPIVFVYSTDVLEICSEQISISDSKSEYLIKQLFKAFFTHPKQLPDYVLEKYCNRSGIEFNRATLDVEKIQKDPRFIRTICDHIAGMTDQFAAREYYRLYIPEYK